jgi:hypothetical protein
MREMAEELRKGLRTSRKSMIKFSVGHDEPEIPAPLHEPTDMVVVSSPCHPWEPIKVMEDWRRPVHCLVCGEQFSV